MLAQQLGESVLEFCHAAFLVFYEEAPGVGIGFMDGEGQMGVAQSVGLDIIKAMAFIVEDPQEGGDVRGDGVAGGLTGYAEGSAARWPW